MDYPFNEWPCEHCEAEATCDRKKSCKKWRAWFGSRWREIQKMLGRAHEQ
jgi:hypothetical protein